MSYNRKYEHDIFLSYGRIDNRTLTEDEIGWVDLFIKSLQITMDKFVGRAGLVKFWKDTEQIQGNQVFDSTIEKGLENSAILLCLLSPGYLSSSYCLKELQHFHQKAERDDMSLIVGDRNRICYVRLDKLDREHLPGELGRSTGFDIYNREAPEARVGPYTVESGEANKVIRALSNAIIDTLGEIANHTSEDEDSGLLNNQEESTEDKEDEFSIFLADVPENLKSLKYKTSQFLLNKGFQIIQDIPPPFENLEHEKKVLEILQKVDLSIHLLSDKPGIIIEERDDYCTYPQRQTELAFENVQDQLIWTPNNLNLEEIDNPDHQKFLTELHVKKERDYQLIRGQKSTLENDVEDLIMCLQERKQKKGIFDRSNVLLNTHIKDQYIANDISQRLLDHNVRPFFNSQEDDPSNNLTDLANLIKQVNRIVFVYGGISKNWLLALMSETLKVIVNNDFPVEDFTIFMVPPEKKREDLVMKQKFMKVNVIDNSSSKFIEPSNLKVLLGNE